MPANGPRLLTLSALALATTSSLGSSMLFVATVTYLPDIGRAIWVITRPCADSRMREPSCRADRTRTCNLRFWRPLLYQLSHRPSTPNRAVGTKSHRLFMQLVLDGCQKWA